MNNSSNWTNFDEYLREGVEDRHMPLANTYLDRAAKKRESPLKLVIESARKELRQYEISGNHEKVEDYRNTIQEAEQKGMMDGSFQLTEEGARSIYENVKRIVVKQRNLDGRLNYLELLKNFDHVRDADLIATGLFCLPEVREKLGDRLENFYKVVLNVGSSRRRGYSLPEKRRFRRVSQDNFFPSDLKQLLEDLPDPRNDEDYKYQTILKTLIRKKSERDVFSFFKEDEVGALKKIEELASEERFPAVKEAYTDLANAYRTYIEFQPLGVNPDFIDPKTGKKGTLPSLHQKIGIYEIVNKKRFGIWDGGGTGKTAIAILAYPLIEKAMNEKGKEFTRGIVVCPNPGKKAWRRGLLGNKNQRYLSDEFLNPEDVLIINGERKDDEFLDMLKEKKLIVVNYEQLTTNVNGGEELFVNRLIDLGFDYAIYDEAHYIKGLRETTFGGKNGKSKPTHSAAARALALSVEYYAPMSATPISNGLQDFAIQYHLLNPSVLKDPNKFMELINHSPRHLFALFHENSVRRTSEEINSDLEWTESENLVELSNVQRKLYNHIVEFRPESWLTQARKSILDPRLVDPEILKRAGVLGQIDENTSIKYKKLEDLLASPEGPLERKDKFVIFTLLKEGVTRPNHAGIRKRYQELGFPNEFERLNLNKSLDMILSERLSKRTGRKVNIGIIDGDVLDVEERDRVISKLYDGLDGIICTTDTGGESLDFTAANWTYFLEEDFVPDTEEQAIWRELRIGQKKVVHVNHLRADDTLDLEIKVCVDKKRIIAKMATDGIPPSEEEWALLSDTDGRHLGDMIRKSIGGRSINVYNAEAEDLEFNVKKRGTRQGSSRKINPSIYDTTVAQKIMQWIGKDPVNCWKDPEFVELYMQALPNIAPHVIHSAKIFDLVSRAKRKEIEFPGRVLSEGAGPSLLYNTYHFMSKVLMRNGLSIPEVVDRDTSQAMLDRGANPNKILGDMTGEESKIKKGSFDMVDNESITLLRNSDEVYSALRETNRVLKQDGLVELIVKNQRFSDSFYSGMENLGFELISKKNEGFSLGRDSFRKLRRTHGDHFASSYSAKLSNTFMILAKKKDEPAEANPDDFWFEMLGNNEDNSDSQDNQGNSNIRDPSQSNSIVIPRSRRKGGSSKSRSKGTSKKERINSVETQEYVHIPNPDGTVISRRKNREGKNNG